MFPGCETAFGLAKRQYGTLGSRMAIGLVAAKLSAQAALLPCMCIPPDGQGREGVA